MTTISSVNPVDLSKISTRKLRDLLAFFQKQQRWHGGYQKLLNDIEAELEKPNRPADATA